MQSVCWGRLTHWLIIFQSAIQLLERGCRDPIKSGMRCLLSIIYTDLEQPNLIYIYTLKSPRPLLGNNPRNELFSTVQNYVLAQNFQEHRHTISGEIKLFWSHSQCCLIGADLIQSEAEMNYNHSNYLQDSFYRTQVVKGKKVFSCCSVAPFSSRFVLPAA